MSSPVVLVAVLLYFAAVSGVLGLIMLPHWQAQAGRLVVRAWQRLRPGQELVLPAGLRKLGRPFAALHAGLEADRLPPHLMLLGLLTAVVIAAGPVAGLLLHERIGARLPLASFGTPSAADDRIAPRLAPAMVAEPLPPAWLHEAGQPRGQEHGADRDWSKLQPQFRRRLVALFEIAQERHGYQVVLMEGHRSAERQARLAALGPATTLAGPDRSRHQAGLAADLAFVRDGRLHWSERDPWTLQAYRHIGEIATSLGLQWGGHWTSLRDLAHVEWRDREPASAPGAPPSAAVLASAR
ncbi:MULTISPECIES: M15 family metallopeptidase [unclassified Rubrivivax]|uniref:M15 family metallopeptidase n=1 Tax=unclassified Rubrivivax TaxID=2649762 RepID=UPI0013E92A4A|nr:MULTISPECIES: M15 family metallopeptidase [unclassified Rubrivivax]MCC9597936.1 M15 family metallopeptidase [Rubrivivax sp. JA1055]MCC9645807.1 M15 family metallopeptidase [Rubrivivax sp. JA1029]MCD0417905.1 M15 family metallopeptidase [Rubrivivax sp. JA1024]